MFIHKTVHHLSNRSQYWNDFNRFAKRNEMLYAKVLNRALRSQIDDYIKSGTVSSISSEPIVNALEKLVNDVSVQWAWTSGKFLPSKKARMPLGFSKRIIDLMRDLYGPDLLNMSENITQTTIDQIRTVLDMGTVNGWSFEEIVKRLKSPELTSSRALLIARTEVISSANSAAVANAKDLNIEVKKEWIATNDSRTRRDHIILDGQIVGMNELFHVVDQKGITRRLSQPGDRTHGAGPGEVCNCRCVVAFV